MKIHQSLWPVTCDPKRSETRDIKLWHTETAHLLSYTAADSAASNKALRRRQVDCSISALLSGLTPHIWISPAYRCSCRYDCYTNEIKSSLYLKTMELTFRRRHRKAGSQMAALSPDRLIAISHLSHRTDSSSTISNDNSILFTAVSISSVSNAADKSTWASAQVLPWSTAARVSRCDMQASSLRGLMTLDRRAIQTTEADH